MLLHIFPLRTQKATRCRRCPFLLSMRGVVWLCIVVVAPHLVLEAACDRPHQSAQTLFEGTAYVTDLAVGPQLLLRLPGSDVIPPLLHHEQSGGARCPALLIYYDSTCGHCRTMAPRLANMSALLASDVETRWLLVGAVNCAVNAEECEQRNVTDVPTLFFLRNASDGEGWGNPLQSTSDANVIVAEVRERLRHTATGKPLAERDACAAARDWYISEKQGHMNAALSLQSNESRERSSFFEERAFHPRDVVASLYYTLYHEVSMVPLTKQKRSVIAAFLAVMDGALPGMWLGSLRDALHQNEAHDGIPWSPSEWRSLLVAARLPFESAPSSDGSSQPVWRTCRGSAWKYRGFTCGLWLMYHAAVANAASDAAAFDALVAIRAYALSFFACADCRRHFSQFQWWRTSQHPHQWHPVVQLWAAHNQVNHRLSLSRDGSDPLVLKRQFPDAPLCGSCIRNSIAMDEAARGKSTFALQKDDQAVHMAFLNEVYDVNTVLHFLLAWYKWRPAELPVQTEDSPVNRSPMIPPCPPEGDTCPLPPRHPRASSAAPVPFLRTRHPDFVVRRDPLALHATMSLILILVACGAGYAYTSKGKMWNMKFGDSAPIAASWSASSSSHSQQNTIISRRRPGSAPGAAVV